MKESTFPINERKFVFILLMLSAGIMGGYTYTLHGGVFCNAQTANLLLLALSLGQGQWGRVGYYLVPLLAYGAGALGAEVLSHHLSRRQRMTWPPCLIAGEIVLFIALGFVPSGFPHWPVQVISSLIAAMQFATFREAEDIAASTTICTSHLREAGVTLARVLLHGDSAHLSEMLFHLLQLGAFAAGALLVALVQPLLFERVIWLAIVPLSIVLCCLLHE